MTGMKKSPVAYLRKSRITSDHHLSWEMQEADIRTLAERHGSNGNLVILSDWGKSGRGAKVRLRKGYAELLKMVESDQVSALFGYSMSRLARSLGDYVKLAELCRDHGVPIHLAKEGTLDYSTASGRLLVNLLASVAQAEADWGSERATDAMRVRQSRGEYIGQVGYGYRLKDGKVERNPAEPVDVVLDAFMSAGSYNGAAKILNESGVQGRGPMWSMTGVRAVIRREAPALVKHGRKPGVRTILQHRFAQLVRCHCGTTLTPIRNSKGYVSYMCWSGYRDPRHRRPYMVSEGKLRPWIEAEAARLRLPFDQVTLGTRNATKRGELIAQRERLGWDVVNKALGPEKAAAAITEIDAQLELLDDQEQIIAVPPLDWEKSPASVNDVLRAMWRFVQLDGDMKPVAAEWVRPEWRKVRTRGAAIR
jgi:DNA invertase Pin-like site-specific DNA recombinase